MAGLRVRLRPETVQVQVGGVDGAGEIGLRQPVVETEQVPHVGQLRKAVCQQLVEEQQIGLQLFDLRLPLGAGRPGQAGRPDAVGRRKLVQQRVVAGDVA
ncbi:hypothetical protein, partial [Methylogaea oryzae]|uniref:hypothetical protein n=1 Tax=Methylogaea oryzae TaxID=1295382 RepID=UPI0012E1BC99